MGDFENRLSRRRAARALRVVAARFSGRDAPAAPETGKSIATFY
jgi:hypothetical protein